MMMKESSMNDNLYMFLLQFLVKKIADVMDCAMKKGNVSAYLDGVVTSAKY